MAKRKNQITSANFISQLCTVVCHHCHHG